MALAKDWGFVFDKMRSGVYVVTSAYRRKPAGCTAVWISRASFEPPLLAINLAPGRHTMRTIEKSRRLCVNVLGESGLQLAKHFGFTSGLNTDKFQSVAYHIGASGSPILAVAIGYFDCRVVSVMPAGDHTLVLAEVIDAAVVRSEKPLVYDSQMFYTGITQHAQAEAAKDTKRQPAA